VAYLIYPGTSGAPFLDYIIADRHVLPAEHAPGYTEKVVYMPHSYQVNYYHARHFAIQGQPLDRAALRLRHGLPADGMVLANLNKNDKLEPEVFAVWMRILARLPGSVLWLLRPSAGESGQLIIQHLTREASRHGVAPERLIFAARTSKGEHLARQGAADLFLDSFYYGAHSTATDALRAGLPVLSNPGDAFPRRVAASLLHNVGASQAEALLVSSWKEYEDVAVFLGQHRHVLEELRGRLGAEGPESPLFDTRGFTREVERAFEVFWEVREATHGMLHVVVGPQGREV
jgi:protein O-GlcNAc transferase